MGFIGAKHTVFDIYPIHKKKIFLLVDPECIIDYDFYSTVASIDYLTEKGASVIVASSFGSLTGIKFGCRHEDDALKTFSKEGGVGYTNWFSALSSAKKVEVLQRVPSLHIDADYPSTKKGKTALFASLTNEEKEKAMKELFPMKEFSCSSTRMFVPILQERLPKVTVSFSETIRLKKEIQPGSVVVLENLRFYKNERSMDPAERQALADVLASQVDLFVNDSFSTSHLIQASTVELPRRLQHGAAGQTLDRELAFYSKLLNHPTRPIALVVGGINISKKLKLIYTLVEKVDRILVAGRIALPFIIARGLQCGKSYVLDEEQMVSIPSASSKTEFIRCSELAKKILEMCEKRRIDIIAPSDFLVATDPDASPTSAVNVNVSSIPEDSYVMDIGHSSVNIFSRVLRSCRTVVWTGVLGWTSRGYQAKTAEFATSIMNHTKTHVIVAGRCTARIVRESILSINEGLVHISPGGLPCLEILEGNVLPGVEALSDVSADTVDVSSSVSADGLVRKLPLFVGCHSHQMKALARKFVRRVHGKGEYIFHKGDKVVRLCIIAQGAFIAKGGAEFDTSPSRYITKGQTVGMYEFISQAAALETVRVAQNDTVTYQLSYSSLNELLNAYPQLSLQLLQNLTKQLSLIAVEAYDKQHSIPYAVKRMGCMTRIPHPEVSMARGSMWEDILYDLLCTSALQHLSMRYNPYVPCGERTALPPPSDQSSESSAFLSLVEPFYRYQGLPYSLGYAVLKDVIYHQLIPITHEPYTASVVSSVLASPLRLLAYGIPYTDFNFNLMLEEAMYSGILSVAPLVAFGLYLQAQKQIEHYFRRRLQRVSQIALMMIIKMMLGNICFLVAYQRNFLYTPPSASEIWNTRAYQAYQAKQALSILIRLFIHHFKTVFF